MVQNGCFSIILVAEVNMERSRPAGKTMQSKKEDMVGGRVERWSRKEKNGYGWNEAKSRRNKIGRMGGKVTNG